MAPILGTNTSHLQQHYHSYLPYKLTIQTSFDFHYHSRIINTFLTHNMYHLLMIFTYFIRFIPLLTLLFPVYLKKPDIFNNFSNISISKLTSYYGFSLNRCACPQDINLNIHYFVIFTYLVIFVAVLIFKALFTAIIWWRLWIYFLLCHDQGLLWRFYFVEDLWYFMIAALVNGVGDFVLLTFKQLFIDHIFFLFRFSDVIWMYIMHVIFIVWYNFILSWIHYDVAFENVKKFLIMILVSFWHFCIAALVKSYGDFILLAFKELFSEFGASVGIFFPALFVIFYEASLGLVYGTSVDLFYGAAGSSSFGPLLVIFYGVSVGLVYATSGGLVYLVAVDIYFSPVFVMFYEAAGDTLVYFLVHQVVYFMTHKLVYFIVHQVVYFMVVSSSIFYGTMVIFYTLIFIFWWRQCTCGSGAQVYFLLNEVLYKAGFIFWCMVSGLFFELLNGMNHEWILKFNNWF